MTTDNVVGAVVAVCLLVYLLYTLLWPEKL